MKLDNNNKDSETNRKMMMNREKSVDGITTTTKKEGNINNNSRNSNTQNTSTTSNNNNNTTTTTNSKEKLKQEKLQKEKEKRLEKERKEREKKEKERIDKENKQKKTKSAAGGLNSSTTSGDINKLSKQFEQKQAVVSSSQSNLNTTGPIPQSKSENMLTRLKKQTSLFGDKSNGGGNKKIEPPVIVQPSPPQTQMPEPPHLISQPRNRYRAQVIYLDESVKTFDIDVSRECGRDFWSF